MADQGLKRVRYCHRCNINISHSDKRCPDCGWGSKWINIREDAPLSQPRDTFQHPSYDEQSRPGDTLADQYGGRSYSQQTRVGDYPGSDDTWADQYGDRSYSRQTHVGDRSRSDDTQSGDYRDRSYSQRTYGGDYSRFDDTRSGDYHDRSYPQQTHVGDYHPSSDARSGDYGHRQYPQQAHVRGNSRPIDTRSVGHRGRQSSQQTHVGGNQRFSYTQPIDHHDRKRTRSNKRKRTSRSVANNRSTNNGHGHELGGQPQAYMAIEVVMPSPNVASPITSAADMLNQANRVLVGHEYNHGEVRLPGIHNWVRTAHTYISWCYAHGHPIRTKKCTSKDEHPKPAYIKALLVKSSLPPGYTPLARNIVPQTYWDALTELTQFGRSMLPYISDVQIRDEFQQNISAALDADQVLYDWALPVRSQLEDSFVKLNLHASDYFHAIQGLSKHCSALYCDKILDDMHKYGLLLHFKSVRETAKAAFHIVNLYEYYCEMRHTEEPNEPVDLPITDDMGSVWTEFVDRIIDETEGFMQAVTAIRIQSAAIGENFKGTPYELAFDFITKGNFLVRDVVARQTSLPTFIFTAVRETQRQLEDSFLALYASDATAAASTTQQATVIDSTTSAIPAVQRQTENITNLPSSIDQIQPIQGVSKEVQLEAGMSTVSTESAQPQGKTLDDVDYENSRG